MKGRSRHREKDTPQNAFEEQPLKPFLRWAGGKGRMLDSLIPYVPSTFKTYAEPFLGSAALFFRIGSSARSAYLADANQWLVDCYLAVQDDPEQVIAVLQRWPIEKRFFLDLRQRNGEVPSGAEKAAQLVYLMWTCFNGLYRVNTAGRFNVPFGNHLPRDFAFLFDRLRRASEVLNRCKIRLADFSMVLENSSRGTFVYLDPPYQRPFNGRLHDEYTVDGFGPDEQERLAGVFKKLDKRGCKVMLTNSATAMIERLYEGYRQRLLRTRRHICAQPELRREARELIITNY